MRFCIKCGQQNEDDSMFCISCGAEMEPLDNAAQPSFTSPAAQAMPAGQAGANAFQPVAPEAAPDAFAQREVAASAQQFPQDTIDIYAAAAHAKEAPAEPSPEGKAGAGPAHAVDSSHDASEVLMAMEDLDERLATVESLVKDRSSSLEELVGKLSEQFEGKISRNEHEASVLKSMSDEMQEYRDGLYAKLTLPLVRDIIEAREALGMALARSAADGSAADGKLVSEIELVRDMLADSLMRNSVEIVATEPGEDFASFKHKIVGKVHTSDSAQHGRVAEVSGDSYKMGDQFISPAMVKVYTIEEAAE